MSGSQPDNAFQKALDDGTTMVNRREYAAAGAAAEVADELAKDPAQRADAALLRGEIALAVGNRGRAKQEYVSVFADRAIPALKRYEARVMQLCIASARDKTALSQKALEEAAQPLAKEGLTTPERYAALDNAAKTMTRLRDYERARELLALADALAAPKPKKTYRCAYMEQVPLGAGGWALSDFIKDPANREARFEDYDQDAADMLFSDITVERSVTSDAARKAYYLENTAFYMAYDHVGWHMFVRCGEPDLEKMPADDRSAGALEMYFSRGHKGGTYFQWIIPLPRGKCASFEWDSPHRFFRPLKDYMRAETVVFGDTIGAYIFVPWEALYNKLPLNGGEWPFGCIRWTPAGGITWSGKVHEIGRWGLVEWEKPSPDQAAAIKTNIIKRAWSKYRKTRDFLSTHWNDEILGDPEFHDAVLRPAIERWDRCGDKITNLISSDRETVTALWQDVPGLMEFKYEVETLRREYLADALLS